MPELCKLACNFYLLGFVRIIESRPETHGLCYSNLFRYTDSMQGSMFLNLAVASIYRASILLWWKHVSPWERREGRSGRRLFAIAYSPSVIFSRYLLSDRFLLCFLSASRVRICELNVHSSPALSITIDWHCKWKRTWICSFKTHTSIKPCCSSCSRPELRFWSLHRASY